jgi:hypothetical protein
MDLIDKVWKTGKMIWFDLTWNFHQTVVQYRIWHEIEIHTNGDKEFYAAEMLRINQKIDEWTRKAQKFD